MESGLEMYVVYENPKDFPGKFVVRHWKGLAADMEPTAIVGCLAEARAAIPEHCVCIHRFKEDDPAILEVWL